MKRALRILPILALAFLAAGGPRGIVADLTPLVFPTPIGLPGAWLALTLSTYPFVLLTAAAALHRIDPALEEAARRREEAPVVLGQIHLELDDPDRFSDVLAFDA